jgi:type VI protein secretion system component Hcp
MANAQLTYLLKIDGIKGDSTIKGFEGYFTVDEFTFNELTRLANGGAGGSSGKPQFDPLMVDIAGLPPGLVTLLKDAATGKHIPSVELVGLKPAGEGTLQKVYDLTLNNVTVAGYAADGKHDTALAFGYSKLTETIKAQKPDGSLDAGQTFTFDLAHNGGSIAPVNHDALAAFAHSHAGPALTYLLKIDGVTGDSTIKGFEGYFTVDEFTFNELTRLTNGGAGGNGGKAQFDPLMVDIAGLSPALVALLKDAATGKHIPGVELVGLRPAGEGTVQKVYDLTLNNVTVAGYAADGKHDTALAFDCSKLTETIHGQKPDGTLDAGQTFTFDLAHNGGSIAPVNHDTLAAFAHSHVGPALTYLLKIDGVTGDSTIKGFEGYFTVDEFTFNELTKLANGGAGGSSGKAQFDPLMVDIAGLSPGFVTLLKDAAIGKHIPSVELVGLKPAGEGTLQKVYDLTLNNVALADYAADGKHDTALAFDYTKLTETIQGQKPDGTLDTGQTFSFDLTHSGGSLAPVNHDALAAFAHSHTGPALTYLLKVDGVSGDSTIKGFEGYFSVDEFTFNELTKFAIGGAGAGKAQFDPLTVDIAGLPPGLVTLLKDAATGKHIPSVELVGLKPAGEGTLQKIYDLTLNNVAVAGYAADGKHDTALAFDFSKLTETIQGQKPDGTLDTGRSFTFDLAHGGSLAPVNHDALTGFAHSHVGPALTYLLKVDGVTGDSTIKGFEGYFTVDEFTFNELTKLAIGGAVAGKAQFDPLTVDLAGVSPGLVTLLKDATTGKHIPSVELVGLKPAGEGTPQKVYDLKLNDVGIAGYAADSGHATALAFDFSKLTETIQGQKPDGTLGAGQTFSFDLAHTGGSITPVNHDALTAFAHSHAGPALTYLLKVDGVTGDSTIKGFEGDFRVDEVTFNELTKFTNGGAGGSGSKPQFDPLMVDIAGQSPGLVTLLKDAATGKHIPSVELIGLKPAGGGTPQKVYDLTLDNVRVAGYATDGGHDTAVAFDYGKLTETIKGQKSDGSLDTGQTFTFDLAHHGGSIAPVNHDALAALAHAHDGFFMV